jgi:hypothetical protein
VRRNPIDFCSVEQDTAPDANGFQLSGALQPVERCFAYLQEHQNLRAGKQARGSGILGKSSNADASQDFSPYSKRAEFWRHKEKLGEPSRFVGEHCRFLLPEKSFNVPEFYLLRDRDA